MLPSWCYGPFAHKFLPLPKPEYDPLSTNLVIYNLLSPTGHYLPVPGYVDFRDVARAHVGALNNKPDKNRKRVVIASPHGLTDKHVLDIIKKEHPELERRFITAPVPELPCADRVDVEFERFQEVTGMRKEDFHTLEEVCCI